MKKNLIPLFVLFVLILFPSLLVAEDIQKQPPSKTLDFGSVHPKLQSVLQRISDKSKLSVPRASKYGRKKGVRVSEDKVTVIIEPQLGRSHQVDLAQLRQLGARIESISTGLLRASIPVANLTSVANRVSGVEFIRLPYPMETSKIDTSEGVSLTNASNLHKAGLEGKNVKVAIIDLGFDELTEAKDSGDIPPEVIEFTRDYTSGNNIESHGSHGTNVAEIIHDMVPQAQLYLMKIGDEVDLQNAKEDASALGVNIINHSVGWFNTSFYDGTGFVAGVAADARKEGIFWVNAAGNTAKTHWQGEYSDADGDSYHEFANRDECNGVGTIYSGNRIQIYMTWDAWPDDSEDYDLYLLNSNDRVVASSTDFQTGTQIPTEKIIYTVESTDQYCFAVFNKDAPGMPAFEVFLDLSSGSPSMEYQIERSSIVTPANDEEVLAVGAIDRSNWATGPEEYFSSKGPSNSSKFSSARIKPDIMGPDRVSTSIYGIFIGTSASAPHVAGAASLLLAENPSRSADELQSLLESNATEMGAPGKDNIYGAGKLTLNFDVKPPPQIDDFTATDGENSRTSLKWTNPTTSDLAKIVVRRKSTRYPLKHTDGKLIYENNNPESGASVQFTDEGLTNGSTYYYAVFSKDTKNNWNDWVGEEKNADTAFPGEFYSTRYVISHWDSEKSQVDTKDDPVIDTDEILQAIAWWANDVKVPKTRGATIGTDKVLSLISYWARGTEITGSSTIGNG